MVRWNELEFRQLEYAIAVKSHQSFLQAAIAIGLDQGFLSKQIQRLEAKLGFGLFDRTTRPLSVTAAGETFLVRAEKILEQTKKAIELAQATQAGQQGRLDVGINTSIANSKLPDIIQAFLGQFPNVRLTLHELASYEQIEQLQNHQIDIGFFHQHNLQGLLPEDSETFTITPILRESIVLVLPAKHLLAKQTTVSLADLNGKNFVLPPRTLLHDLRNQIDELCIRANCQPVVVQEATWITTVLSLVAGGMGISLLPANVKDLQRTGVVYRDLQEPLPLLEMMAVRRSDNGSVVLRNFLEVIRNLS
jgi:DNA-binding transcriptional LysR family regulator